MILSSQYKSQRSIPENSISVRKVTLGSDAGCRDVLQHPAPENLSVTYNGARRQGFKSQNVEERF
jgi:hypothetical protein